MLPLLKDPGDYNKKKSSRNPENSIGSIRNYLDPGAHGSRKLSTLGGELRRSSPEGCPRTETAEKIKGTVRHPGRKTNQVTLTNREWDLKKKKGLASYQGEQHELFTRKNTEVKNTERNWDRLQKKSQKGEKSESHN